MEREILLLGNPALYEISEEVKEEELELLRPVFEDMFDCIRGIRRDYGFGRAIAAPIAPTVATAASPSMAGAAAETIALVFLFMVRPPLCSALGGGAGIVCPAPAASIPGGPPRRGTNRCFLLGGCAIIRPDAARGAGVPKGRNAAGGRRSPPAALWKEGMTVRPIAPPVVLCWCCASTIWPAWGGPG